MCVGGGRAVRSHNSNESQRVNAMSKLVARHSNP